MDCFRFGLTVIGYFMLVAVRFGLSYTLWISRWIATTRERISGSIG
ncbi:hypothetical protein [Photorhabdus sp. RW14-46]|nr:hypothetical protein [Photorhabdus sp. RW14-46]